MAHLLCQKKKCTQKKKKGFQPERVHPPNASIQDLQIQMHSSIHSLYANNCILKYFQIENHNNAALVSTRD